MNPRGLEKILKALANRKRLAILVYLKKNREASVSDIAGEIDLSFKSTSKHLRILSSAEILERNQKTHWGYYRLAQKQHPVVKNILSALK